MAATPKLGKHSGELGLEHEVKTSMIAPYMGSSVLLVMLGSLSMGTTRYLAYRSRLALLLGHPALSVMGRLIAPPILAVR